METLVTVVEWLIGIFMVLLLVGWVVATLGRLPGRGSDSGSDFDTKDPGDY